MPTWIRVRDPKTGHEFDVEERALAHQAGLERIEGYPTLSGPGARPRPAKPFVGKDGQPAVPGPRAPEQLHGAAPQSDASAPNPEPPAPPADKTEE